MSIIIKGMDMPRNCGECSIPCKCMDVIVPHEYHEKRHVGCPLVELPPHGDLIDRNRIIEEIKMATDDDTCPIHVAAEVDQILETAPTVLETEE